MFTLKNVNRRNITSEDGIETDLLKDKQSHNELRNRKSILKLKFSYFIKLGVNNLRNLLYFQIIIGPIQIILKRIYKQIKKYARWNYNKSIRTGKLQQTIDRLIIKKTAEYNKPHCLDFVDYEKAFNSEEHAAVFNSGRKLGINATKIEPLQNIYENNTTMTLQKDTDKKMIKKKEKGRWGHDHTWTVYGRPLNYFPKNERENYECKNKRIIFKQGEIL